MAAPPRPAGAYDYRAYVRAAMAEGTTSNGVFGARPMWGTLDQVTGKLRAAHPGLDEHNTAWQRWFTVHNVVPHRVRYEDLTADPTGVASDVLDYLGLQLPAGRTITAPQRRRADRLNQEWKARYAG